MFATTQYTTSCLADGSFCGVFAENYWVHVIVSDRLLATAGRTTLRRRSRFLMPSTSAFHCPVTIWSALVAGPFSSLAMVPPAMSKAQ
eukprot:SAG22_NODE_128_length_18787_cov_19.577108_15_plen_88_part_00